MWTPIVTDPEKKERIAQKVADISDQLSKTYGSAKNIGLLDGRSGFSLFFSYLNKYQQSYASNEIISDLISASFEEVNNGFGYPTFSNGISGFMWTLHHLSQEGFMDEEESSEEMLSYLGDHMLTYAREEHFDYLHGANGIGLYLVHLYDKVDKHYFSELIRLLREKGIATNDSIKWESLINYDTGQRAYNLSLSHGIASTIVFLSHLITQQPEHNETLDLLNRCINYLLSTKFSADKNLNSLYPGFVDDSGKDYDSRLSWCYGDLGASVALHKAGTVLNRPELVEEAIAVMLSAAQKRGPMQQQVFDAGVCHGTAGLAHIFNHFYQLTGNETFKEAAVYWLDETLLMARFDDGPAGFKRYSPKDGWEDAFGFLDGIAGIGLVLMSTISDVEPKWDRCLLLS